MHKDDLRESTGILAGIFAHDFNNLLTVILGKTNLAKMHIGKDSPAYEILCDVENTALTATHLTGKLQTLAREYDAVKAPMAVGQVVISAARQVIGDSGQACRFDIPEGVWPSKIDMDQIHLAFRQIIDNACRAQPEGGGIDIRLANISDIAADSGLDLAGGRYIRILIRDHGKGMSKEALDNAFNLSFFTSDKRNRLGLPLARAIITQHGGRLILESAIGKGTTVTIYLPAAESSQ